MCARVQVRVHAGACTRVPLSCRTCRSKSTQDVNSTTGMPVALIPTRTQAQAQAQTWTRVRTHIGISSGTAGTPGYSMSVSAVFVSVCLSVCLCLHLRRVCGYVWLSVCVSACLRQEAHLLQKTQCSRRKQRRDALCVSADQRGGRERGVMYVGEYA